MKTTYLCNLNLSWAKKTSLVFSFVTLSFTWCGEFLCNLFIFCETIREHKILNHHILRYMVFFGECGSYFHLSVKMSMIWFSPRDLQAASITWEKSACGAVIYQTQRAGWEPIPFLCHLMLSLRTAILVGKCPYPWVIRHPPWENSLTFYYASTTQTTPRVTVTRDIHHISLDTNTEKMYLASSVTIHLFFF